MKFRFYNIGESTDTRHRLCCYHKSPIYFCIYFSLISAYIHPILWVNDRFAGHYLHMTFKRQHEILEYVSQITYSMNL